MNSAIDGWSLILTAPRPLPEVLEGLSKRCEAESAEISFVRTWAKRTGKPSQDGLWAVELKLDSSFSIEGMPWIEEAANESGNPQLGFSLLPWQQRRLPKRLLAMDMDSTLIEQEGIDELARQAGVYEQVARVTERAMRGEMDFDESLRQRCLCLAGAKASIFEQVRSRLTLTPGAEELLQSVRKQGCRTALLSGGFQEVGQPLARQLGFDHFQANRLEVRQGRLTGRLQGPIINGRLKADIVGRLARQQGASRQEIVVLGDGANDLPMLAEAGLGIAFDAKPAVRKQAEHSLNVRRLDGAIFLMGGLR